MDGQTSTQPAGLSATITAPPNWALIARAAIEHQEAVHSEGELTTLLALMHSITPTVILEIGTWRGGTTWAFSHIPSVQRIITVDSIAEYEAIDRTQRLGCPVKMITGNSVADDTREHVKTSLDLDRADVIVIDSDGSYEDTAANFGHYGAYGRPGGLIVLHGTQRNPDGTGHQVAKLWAELAVVYRTTEIVDVPGGPGGTGIVWL